uniref:Uncharacterized protein n=1 Tax=Psilocybe cubensis TaxID=181762 RepID=A0A8H7XMW4_PSICU
MSHASLYKLAHHESFSRFSRPSINSSMYTTEFQQIEKEYELYKAKRRREKSLLIRTEKAPGGLQAASSSVSSFDASRDGLSSSSVGLSSLADRQELDQIKAELREATKVRLETSVNNIFNMRAIRKLQENLKMRESLEEVQRTKDNFQFEIVEKHRALMRAQDDIRLLNDTLHKLQAEAIRCQSEHKRILQIEHVLQAYAHCSVCSNFVREPVMYVPLCTTFSDTNLTLVQALAAAISFARIARIEKWSKYINIQKMGFLHVVAVSWERPAAYHL